MNTTPSPRGLLIRGLIIFGLVALLMMAYHWTHRPFGIDPLNPRPEAAARIVSAMLEGLAALGMLISAGGLGRLLLSRLDRAGMARAERVALDLGMGLGAFSLYAAALGLIGLFTSGWLWNGVVVAGVIGILRRQIGAHLREWRDLLAGVRVESAWTAFLLILNGGLLALALLPAFAPQTHWDALVYHLPAPLAYLREGAIRAHPDNFYFGFPQNVEMLFAYIIGFSGRGSPDAAAALLHFALGVIGLLATAGVTRRYAGVAAAWLAITLLLGAYSLWALFGWAYVDLGAFAYGALALSAVFAWEERKQQRPLGWLLVMGVIVGLAAGVKYTAGVIGVSLGVYVLLSQPRRVLVNGAIMIAAALAVFAVWLVKGALLYENPIYPFLFDGVNWDSTRMAAFNYTGFGIIGRGDAWQIPLLPFAATVFGVSRLDGFGFTAGAWLLTAFALLPLVWFTLNERAKAFARALLIMLAPVLVYWAFVAALTSTGMQTRLMTMALPIFAAAGAVALDGVFKFPKKPLAIGFIVRVLLIITLIFGAIDALRTTASENTLNYLLGGQARADYMHANTGAYYNAVALNLPTDAQVRFLWEPRSHYCPPTTRCIPDPIFDNWWRTVRHTVTDTDDPLAGFRAQGDDYLLLADTFYREYQPFSRAPEIDARLNELLSAHMTPVWTDGIRYTLWGWRE